MATQTSYSQNFSKPFAGSPGDTGLKRDESFLNDEGSDIPYGIAVTRKSEGKCEEFDAPADVIAGITVHTMARTTATIAGDAIKNGDMANVRALGAIWVQPEETVDVNDPVFVRHTSDGGSNTQLGKFRKSADSARARLVSGARWLTGGTSSAPALLYFDQSAEEAGQLARKAMRKLTLTAAAEAGNAIVVTGQVEDLDGSDVAAAVQVKVTSLAVTDSGGDLTVTAGTSKKVNNPATGENVAWITSTATGGFAVSVANVAAEDTLVTAQTEDGLTAALKLTFA